MSKFILACLLVMGSLQAAPVLTLAPVDGAISGTPGSTIGWGFTLTSDETRWISVTASYILTEDNPMLGTYTDFIGSLGGPVNGSLAPGAGPWTLAFNDTLGEGLGSYTFDPAALVGSVNSGTLRVQVEAFTEDPLECGGQCLDETLLLDVDFSATVTAPPTSEVPEPATLGLTGMALAALAVWRRRRS